MSKKQTYTTFFYYLPSYIFGIITLYSFKTQGISLFLLPITSFGIIPILELILTPNGSHLSPKTNFLNDLMTILIAPFHFYLLFAFFDLVTSQSLALHETIGAVFTMGILCGVYGINVAHELGHRKEKWKQNLAQFLLLSSLYMHFFIEHNRGHHKNVGTPKDPATARRYETIYAFWFRCIRLSFMSAFNLEKDRLSRKGIKWFNYRNQLVVFTLIQIIFCLAIIYIFSFYAFALFLISALIGILLLESINYVEHYGLARGVLKSGAYEQVKVTHSWNSDHILGRYLLFELTRHSHHHENSTIKYQHLESKENSLQLPTGYPGMIILALVPPLFFKVIHKHIP